MSGIESTAHTVLCAIGVHSCSPSSIIIHTLDLAQLLSQDDNCKALDCETPILLGAMETRYEAATVCGGCKYGDKMRGCHGAQGLLWGSMADTNEAARSAARDAVKLLPLKLRYIQAMLEGLASLADLQQSDAPTSAKKRSRVASTRAAATESVIPSEHSQQRRFLRCRCSSSVCI